MREKLQQLQSEIDFGKIGQSPPWQGADVIILHIAPAPTVDGFYPDPRFVETKYVGELSWMFQKLKDVFQECEGFGGWKEELFGRLGNVAVKFQSVCPDASVGELLTVIIEEAFVMAQDIIDQGGIQSLPLTFGNRIYDDFTLLSDGNRYLSQVLVEKRIREYTEAADIAAAAAAPSTVDDPFA